MCCAQHYTVCITSGLELFSNWMGSFKHDITPQNCIFGLPFPLVTICRYSLYYFSHVTTQKVTNLPSEGETIKYILVLSVFNPNTEKYGPEITPYLDTFQAVMAERIISQIFKFQWCNVIRKISSPGKCILVL